MRRARYLAVGIGCALAAAGAAPGEVRSVRIGHLSAVLPRGWFGRAEVVARTPAALTFGNLPVGRWLYLLGQNDPRTRWRYGSIMISVIDDTPGSRRTDGVPSRLPLRVSSVDSLGLEGIDTTHALLRRAVRVNRRVVELWVQFGHLRLTRADLARANRALGGVRVSR